MKRTRIAPTPSGYLHVGNAWSFYLTWLVAKKFDLELCLRIDRGDVDRVREEYLRDIKSSLNWLGLSGLPVIEGPSSHNGDSDAPGPKDLIRQIRILQKSDPGLAYSCSCSRSQIKKWFGKHPEKKGTYPGLCRSQILGPENSPLPIRLRLSGGEKLTWSEWGSSPGNYVYSDYEDFVLAGRDGAGPSYQVSSLWSDRTHSINWIVRGKDLWDSTAYQLYLDKVLGKSGFSEAHFFHHPLIVDPEGKKLSKSAGSTSLLALRNRGEEPKKLFGAFEKLTGIRGNPLTGPPQGLDNWDGRELPQRDIFLPELGLDI